MAGFVKIIFILPQQDEKTNSNFVGVTVTVGVMVGVLLGSIVLVGVRVTL